MNKDKQVGVWNPDVHDFEVFYDISGNRQPQKFVAAAREVTYFPKFLADHVKNHLADHLLHKRGVSKGGIHRSPHDVKKEILKELAV